MIDTSELGDPHHDKSLRSHIGTHPDILAGLVRNDWTMQVMHALVRRVHQSVLDGKSVGVVAYCRGDRHRSVALGWLISFALEFLKDSCSLTHTTHGPAGLRCQVAVVADVIANTSTWMPRLRQKIMLEGCVIWPVLR